MRITEKTKYKEIAGIEQYFTPKTVAAIKEKAEQRFGAMYDLTFAQFYACSNDDFADMLGDAKEPTVLQVYWRKRFDEFVKEFTETLKKFTVPHTPEEEQAAAAMIKTDWAEGMLVFIRNYFGLQSFRAAEQITMGEILIAKKAAYNEAIFRKRLMKIQTAKFNRK